MINVYINLQKNEFKCKSKEFKTLNDLCDHITNNYNTLAVLFRTHITGAGENGQEVTSKYLFDYRTFNNLKGGKPIL